VKIAHPFEANLKNVLVIDTERKNLKLLLGLIVMKLKDFYLSCTGIDFRLDFDIFTICLTFV